MFKHYYDKIYLDGMEIPLKTFRQLEPSYAFPSGLVVMFYDGKMRNYRTIHRSWTVDGVWEEGDRYLARAAEFAALLGMERVEEVAAAAEVEKVKAAAKYPEKGEPNVELQQRTDLNEGGTEGVRPAGKRSSRGRNKHSRGATGGQDQ